LLDGCTRSRRLNYEVRLVDDCFAPERYPRSDEIIPRPTPTRQSFGRCAVGDSFGRLSLTDQTMLCYNRHAGHGQMLRVVVLALETAGAYFLIPVGKTPEFGYMGWKQLTQATRLTVSKDSKIKGFQLIR